MDTHALAAAFPFTSPDLACPLSDTSVLYGANVSSPSLVTWDRWTLDNHNAVILARSGAGKSYFAKLEALRSMYAGIEVAVIDPEDEYARLAKTVGGARIALGSPAYASTPSTCPPVRTRPRTRSPGERSSCTR
jgi:type IV secretory pathway VirB4 component